MIYTKSLNYKYETDVFVAGRCIGTDRQMQASVRVMPGCFITGQAAGAAASLACETEDVRKISVKKLQENLVNLGAYISINQTKENDVNRIINELKNNNKI